MNTSDVIVVRLYIMESSKLLKTILDYLKNKAKIRGVTVFRAISGYGESGGHTSALIELSLDLPLVVEFFDTEANIQAAINHLNTIVKPEHIVFWPAKVNELG